MAYTIDLSGKLAFITGGTRGIGLSCAQLLSQAGARVIIAGRVRGEGEAAVRSLTAGGADARFVALDVTSEEQVVATLAEVAAETGIDILVNSAGVARHCDTPDVDAELWNTIVDTNFKGTFLCCRETARHMLHHGRGDDDRWRLYLAMMPGCGAGDASTLDARRRPGIRASDPQPLQHRH
jgi:NAD(P)-dependent dehydrogenase (short-subunit alcohol dehydrogenase family)